MRLSTKKSGDDVIYYVLDSARKGGKVETWTVQRIGKRSELIKEHKDPEAYARSVVESLNRKKKGNTTSFKQTIDFDEKLPAKGTVSESLAKNIGWLYIKRMFETAGFSSFFESIKGDANDSLSDAVLLLTVGILLSPSSPKGMPNWSENFLGMPKTSIDNLNLTLDRIQNNFNAFQKKIYEGLSSIVDRDESVIYYDDITFASAMEDDFFDAPDDPIQYGMGRASVKRANRTNPIVRMGLFFDHDGMPISYSLFHETGNEQDKFVDEEKKMERIHQKSTFVYCADEGIKPNPEKLYNSFGNRRYIITKSLRDIKDEDSKLLMSDENWFFLDKDEPIQLSTFLSLVEKYAAGKALSKKEMAILKRDTLYKAFPTTFKADLSPFLRKITKEGKETTLEETLYVTFSAKTFLYQKGIFSQEGKQAFHGFYAVASNLDGGIHQILKTNRGRWQIEMRLRKMMGHLEKSFFHKPTLEEAMGCSAVLFLALSILMALKRRLGKELGESEEITEEDILGTLKDMKVLREEKPARYMSLYTGSKVLEALEKAFHLGLDRKYFKASWISELSGSKASE